MVVGFWFVTSTLEVPSSAVSKLSAVSTGPDDNSQNFERTHFRSQKRSLAAKNAARPGPDQGPLSKQKTQKTVWSLLDFVRLS